MVFLLNEEDYEWKGRDPSSPIDLTDGGDDFDESSSDPLEKEFRRNLTLALKNSLKDADENDRKRPATQDPVARDAKVARKEGSGRCAAKKSTELQSSPPATATITPPASQEESPLVKAIAETELCKKVERVYQLINGSNSKPQAKPAPEEQKRKDDCRDPSSPEAEKEKNRGTSPFNLRFVGDKGRLFNASIHLGDFLVNLAKKEEVKEPSPVSLPGAASSVNVNNADSKPPAAMEKIAASESTCTKNAAKPVGNAKEDLSPEARESCDSKTGVFDVAAPPGSRSGGALVDVPPAVGSPSRLSRTWEDMKVAGKAMRNEVEKRRLTLRERMKARTTKATKPEIAKAPSRLNHFPGKFQQQQDIAKISEWLSKNRAMFRKPVFGPVMSEITTKSEPVASYLRRFIKDADLKSYIVQCKEDSDLLYRSIREEQGIPINITVVEEIKPVNRIYSDEMMKVMKGQHGVLGYLDECIEAPAIVLEALRSAAQIEKVLVGTITTQDSLDDEDDDLLDILVAPEDGRRRSVIFTSRGNRSMMYTISKDGKHRTHLSMQTIDAKNKGHAAELAEHEKGWNEVRLAVEQAERVVAEASLKVHGAVVPGSRGGDAPVDAAPAVGSPFRVTKEDIRVAKRAMRSQWKQGRQRMKDLLATRKAAKAQNAATHTGVDVCALKKGQEENAPEKRVSPWLEVINFGKANIDRTPALLSAAKSTGELVSKADLEGHAQAQATETVDSPTKAQIAAAPAGVDVCALNKGQEENAPEKRLFPWLEEIDFGKASIDRTPALLPAAKSTAELDLKADWEGHSQAQATETVDSPTIHATAESNTGVKSTDNTENIPVPPDTRVSPWQGEIDFGKTKIDGPPALLPAAKNNTDLESKTDLEGHDQAQVTKTVDLPTVHASAETDEAVHFTDTTKNIPILPDNIDDIVPLEGTMVLVEARAKSSKIFSFARILKVLFAVSVVGFGSLYVHDLVRVQAIKRERRQRFMINH